uniref:Uncharacterized protein n=1 Tax=Rhizophora mucronata TaxID=61149 RepID=A0A2P2NTB7_RHIMU
MFGNFRNCWWVEGVFENLVVEI